MATMSWAFGFLSTAMTACMNWFSSIISRIPGAADSLVAAFFLAMIISAFILPLRGAGMSDRVMRTKNGKTSVSSYNRTKQIGN